MLMNEVVEWIGAREESRKEKCDDETRRNETRITSWVEMRLGGAADERLDGCPNELLALSHIDVWETAADLMKERIDIE